jgi:hypothetical protein
MAPCDPDGEDVSGGEIFTFRENRGRKFKDAFQDPSYHFVYSEELHNDRPTPDLYKYNVYYNMFGPGQGAALDSVREYNGSKFGFTT